MKVARIVVFGVAIGAGLLAMSIAFRMTSRPPAEPPVALASPETPKIETVEVLVMKRDVAIGATIAPTDLQWEPWPKEGDTDAYITKASRPGAIEEIGGSVARVAFLHGEPVREARLMKTERGFMSVILTPGMRAIAIEVRAVGTAGGFILPSDHVDVLLTRATQKTPGASAGGDPFVSSTLLSNIKVLAIDQQITENKGEAAVVAKNTVTLEVSPRQSEQIVQAQQLGTLSLALRPIRDAKVEAEPEEKVSGTVTVVRYGTTSRVSAQ